jgi:hypothetical protein
MAVAVRVADRASGPFVGTYTGTTATQNIHIGFKPAAIIAWNRSDGDTMWFWSKANIVNYVSVVALAATTTAVVAGVDDGTVIGFSLAASDAIANENTKVYDFIAFPE